MLMADRYRIEATLHSGQLTTVYRAIDTHRNKPVVIKALRPGTSTAQKTGRFKAECELACRANPDWIVTSWDVDGLHTTMILVVDDIGGYSLDIWMKRRRLTLQECLSIAGGIADCVERIHSTNIIHGDLQPSNIVWNPTTNRVDIIDFGVAARLAEQSCVTASGYEDGTLAYMSPEQTGRMNRRVDCSTDFYSFGVTLYELLTGRLPFETDDPLELVHSHLARQATPPHQVDSSIPEVVSRIVLKLMSKTTEERYQSARGLKHDVTCCLEQLRRTGTAAPFLLAQQDFAGKLRMSEKLYGRAEQTRTLQQAFERVSAGRSELLLVGGYSGIGKTSLVNSLYEKLTQERGYFVAGKFDQYTRDAPYSALASALASLVAQVLTEPAQRIRQWQQQLSVALDTNGQVIVDIVPELERLVGPQPRLETVEHDQLQFRLKTTFRRFLQVFASQGHPLVLFLDDLQWVDSGTLKLLSDLATDTELCHLLIVGAYRSNEVDPQHPLMQAVALIEKNLGNLVQVAVSPLSLLHVTQFVSDTFEGVKV